MTTRHSLYAFCALIIACVPAWATTFTTNTTIGADDTSYDGMPIVITHCAVTIDGAHTFASLEVASNGVLTHSYSPIGLISDFSYVSDESQILTGTTPVTLVNSNILTATVIVTDDTGVTNYTTGVDYLLTPADGDLTELQRTTNSSISSGATVLVSYEVLLGATPAGLYLNVISNVEVDAAGVINANGLGYGGGLGSGAGQSNLLSAGGGGGYGGNGGASYSNAPGGIGYGNYLAPTNLGSGGGASYGGGGGAGGGLIEIGAGGSVIINGLVAANGANGTNNDSGGGSGGSIWIIATNLSGSGTITANGGDGYPLHGGGGGGGRIALQCATSSLAGSVSAYGGTGAQTGGAGAVFSVVRGGNGTVVVDNGGQMGTNTFLAIPNLPITASNAVFIQGGAIVTPSGSWTIGNLTIASNSFLMAKEPIITSSGIISIAAGGGLLANAAGSDQETGEGSSSGEAGGGGGYGGNGGAAILSEVEPTGGLAFGSQGSPGSFGGNGGGIGGIGGGWIQITSLGGLLQVDGTISANGGNGASTGGGGGAGGTIVLTGGTLLGGGSIAVNGGIGGGSVGGGGGGGRMALSPAVNLFTGKITAYGGGGGNAGGAGTIVMTVPGQTPQLILDNNGKAGTNTPVQSASSTDLIVRGEAIATALSLATFDDLYLETNGWIKPDANSQSPPSALNFVFNGNATIQAGSGIVADFAGYSTALGLGASDTLNTTNFGGGGGHGGRGGNSFGNDAGGGNTYDSALQPADGGASGGGNEQGSSGGAGGGFIEIRVTGSLELDGIISANGAPGGGLAGGGGAGGGVSVTAGSLSGIGTVSANGGYGASGLGGGGGGGMIYISSDNNSFAGAITAYGGGGANWGGAGTIIIPTKTATQLIVDDDGHAAPPTPLPSDGILNVTLRNGTVASVGGQVSLASVIIETNASLIVSNIDGSSTLSFSSLIIQPGGGLIADSQGPIGGQGEDPGHSSQIFTNGCSGAGHGGNGGNGAGNSAAGGGVYDLFMQPSQAGSGGGSELPYSTGGNGGGVFRLTVSGVLQNDGVISANGGNGSGLGGGGGSGGSIWITANILSGTGSISANGGGGVDATGGGGGGGCVAIYPTADLFLGVISAYGGGGANWGGAGTVYLAVNNQPGQLVLDNNGQFGGTTPIPSIISTSSLVLRNGATGVVSSALNAGSVFVNSNSSLLFSNNVAELSVTFSSVTVQAGGGIIGDAGGEAAGKGPGEGSYAGNTTTYSCSGAGHGGYGGGGAGKSPTGGFTYDTPVGPIDPGSGGGLDTPYSTGGSGGAAIHFEVSGALQNDGVISANGGNGGGLGGGGGSGGSIWITAGFLSGSGAISANGGNGADSAGGGGAGGCIAIYPTTNQFTGPITAYGGGGANGGGAGTVFIANTQNLQTGQLILNNNGQSGALSQIPSSSLVSLILTNGAMGLVTSPITLSSLVVCPNARLLVSNTGIQVSMNFSTADIQAGGGIIGDAGGALAGSGPGPGFYAGNQSNYPCSGAGHGGYGGSMPGESGTGGNAYDNPIQPSQVGSGGGTEAPYSVGGAGGASIRLTVTGQLQNDGVISANGGNGGGLGGGGGSGGTILLSAGLLSGAGLISANGGSGAESIGGGGAGGCIAISPNANQFSGIISAYGGAGQNAGGAGTVYIQQTGDQEETSQITLDNGGQSGALTPVSTYYSSGTSLLLRNGAIGLATEGFQLGNLTIATNGVLLVSNRSADVLMTLSSADIQPGGGLIADSEGATAGEGYGAGHTGVENPQVNYVCGGAGHGGNGGNSAQASAAGGSAYDSQADPSEVGSGGGSDLPYSQGGAGGGAMHLVISGTLENDGVISANGGPGTGIGGGGGSGGSIWLSAGTLSGAGSMTVNGGNGAGSLGGGGAGGCIAISATLDSFAGTISAYGGGGANWGGAGTVYCPAVNNQLAQLILDNNSQAGATTPIGVGETALILRNGALGYQSQGSAFGSLYIGSNAFLQNGPSGAGAPGVVNLTVSGNATIQAGGGIVTDGAGSAQNLGIGEGRGYSYSGNYPCSGGGYGGYGGSTAAGSSLTPGGLAYGSVVSPSNLGSGGGGISSSVGGSGGGEVLLTVNGTLELDGKISANGGNGAGSGGGGGSGGSISLTANAFAGAGSITANGGNGVAGIGGGGGGGRIAIQYLSDDFTGAVSAYGGSGYASGGAGTIYSQVRTQSGGQLLLDGGGETGTSTPLSISLIANAAKPINLTIQKGAIVCPQANQTFPILSKLVIAPGGQLTGLSNQAPLDLLVFNDVDVEAGGSISVDGQGYPEATGPGAGLSAEGDGSGAGYGGIGGASATTPGGPSYGSSNQPASFGSGGGLGFGALTTGAQGGGAIRLNVGGILTVDGEMSAGGEPGQQDNSGGGSGGSIWVTTGALAGAGQFAADGGAGAENGGGGAGGRIALYSYLDAYLGVATASGGAGDFTGGLGTIYTNSVAPLQVISNSPNGIVSNAVSSVILYFSAAPNPFSVTSAGVSLATPNGPLTNSLLVSMLTSSSYQVSFPPQTADGNYSIIVNTNIVDLYGQPALPETLPAFMISLPTIQGFVTDTNGNPLAGVLVQDGTSSTTTDTNGNYVLNFLPGSSFTVTPSLGALVFAPSSISYTNSSASVSNQNYTVDGSVAPALKAAGNGVNFVLSWQCLPGVNYQVYSSPDLVYWQPYGNTVTGVAGPTQVLVPVNGSTAQFFRLQASY